MTADDDTEAADQPTVAAERGATAIVPAATEAVPELAWSLEDPESAPLNRAWRSVWALAGVGVLGAMVATVVIAGLGVVGDRGDRQQSPHPGTAEAAKPPASVPGVPLSFASGPPDAPADAAAAAVELATPDQGTRTEDRV